MQPLETQVREAMRKAMRSLLRQTFAKEALTAADLAWLRRLCVELRERIDALTPHRADLQCQLHEQFDVDLLMQMLEHDAASAADIAGVATVVIERLAMLCAPCQDADVEALRRTLRGATEGHIGVLLDGANTILDGIDDYGRSEQARTIRDTLARRAGQPTQPGD